MDKWTQQRVEKKPGQWDDGKEKAGELVMTRRKLMATAANVCRDWGWAKARGLCRSSEQWCGEYQETGEMMKHIKSHT